MSNIVFEKGNFKIKRAEKEDAVTIYELLLAEQEYMQKIYLLFQKKDAKDMANYYWLLQHTQQLKETAAEWNGHALTGINHRLIFMKVQVQ